MASCQTNVYSQKEWEETPAGGDNLVGQVAFRSHPHDSGRLLRRPVERTCPWFSPWTRMPQCLTRHVLSLGRSIMDHRSAPCRCIWNSCLRQGRLRVKDLQNNGLPKGETQKGTTACR